ncbi:MAG: threonylcarbamoyl-AMP synthase [Oscillospiraceae bacterium]|jgi:L-threonylcarbamoyladenylate synthase|nr:threonylcarbamoyl-AMP synthase [Oscillospiraceae bacterium]
MITKRLRRQSLDALFLAEKVLRDGQLVAVPTETVYGLAANAFNNQAVARIFDAKNRPADNPLIFHVKDVAQAAEFADMTPLAERLFERFSPGPLTIVSDLKSRDKLLACADLDTVAVRIPNNKFLLELIANCGFPLAAPSANISGKPSPTNCHDVLEDMDGRIPLVIDDGESKTGVESTVVTAGWNGEIVILRPGAVTPEQLAEYGRVIIDPRVTEELDDGEVRSPGMKYRHYAPKAKVLLVDGDTEAYAATFASAFPNVKLYVITKPEKNIFAELRDADRNGVDQIIATLPGVTGFDLALRNRLLRAAEFNVVKN